MSIYDYIKELERCDIDHTNNHFEKRSYNGITFAEGVESYTKKLKVLLSDFKQECLRLSNDKISVITKDVNNLLNIYYDIPDTEIIDGMKRDLSQYYNQSLKDDIRFAEFLLQMVATQKYFINETVKWLANFIIIDTPKQITEESTQQIQSNETLTTNVIKGVKGLAEYLNIGKTLAQSIINSKLLMKNNAQYRAGKNWYFNRLKLEELLSKQPEILKDIHTKHH